MSVRTVQLGDLIKVSKGKKASHVFARPTEGSRRYLQIDDLRPDARPKYVEPFACPRASKSDVVIAWDGANAGTVSSNLDGYIGSTLAILRPASERVFAPYLARFIEANFDCLQAQSTGATVPHLDREVLEQLELPLPGLSEQKRVAGLLERADRLRRIRRYARQISDTYVQSLFLQMFDHPGQALLRFEVRELQEVVRFIDYRGIAPNKVASGVPLVTARNVKRGYFDPEPREFIPAAEYDEWMTRGKPTAGDVLFTTEGHTLGSAAKLPAFSRVALAQRLITMSCGDNLTSDYLLQLILTICFQDAVAKRSTGSAARGISSKNLGEIRIPVPPLPLQQQFSGIVAHHDRLRAQQHEALRQADHLFQSLLHRAFSENG